MPSVLITGANRGLGLEFAKQYAANGWQVIAANRTPFTPDDYVSLGMDVTELAYDALDDISAAKIASRLKGRPIDIAIFNAAIPGEDSGPEGITPDHWESVMLTNTYAPLHLASLLEDNLKAGGRKVLATISGTAASIAQTKKGGTPRQFAYRASKAALNQMWRNLSVEWKGWGCIALPLDPGRVKTRMSHFTGDLTPAASVVGMRRVIDEATLASSGIHHSHDGQIVPW